jgi:hypothetical protein
MLPTIIILFSLLLNPVNINNSGGVSMPMASHTMSLEDRYGNTYVNNVFKDNILLTLGYLRGSVKGVGGISWDEVEKPFTYEFTLKPGEEFAFHDSILAQYNGNVVKTTNAHFNYTDGFKSDGYLTGDGVCHLASLVYWTAKDAGLAAIAPRNHNFAAIPDIPREYGVAIYDKPGELESSGFQNLYITNNKENAVKFVFEYKDNALTVSVVNAI